MANWIQKQIKASEYDDWELYFLIASIAISLCIYLDIRLVTTFLWSLDIVHAGFGYTVGELFIAAIQGIVISLAGGWLYNQGDSYFTFVTDRFQPKEVAFLVRIVAMTLLGIGVGLVLPDLIQRYTEFLVVQTAGIVLFVGYLLIHSEIVNWKVENEAPVLVSGFLLTVTPLLT